MATARASTDRQRNGAAFPQAENPLVSPKNVGRVSRFQLDTVDPTRIDEYLSRKATFAVTVKVRYAEPVSQIWSAFISEDAFTWMPTVKGAPYRDAGQAVGAGSRRLIVSSLFVGQEQYEIFVRPNDWPSTSHPRRFPD